MKGTIAIRSNGRASDRQVSEWKQSIEDIFKPESKGGGGKSDGRMFDYYLCDSISADQIKALVIKFGGVIVRKATDENSFEPMLLGKYGNCVFEIPDEGEAYRLEAPPNTLQVEYYGILPSFEDLSPSKDGHTHVVLISNHNKSRVDVDFAVFHVGSSDEPEDTSGSTASTEEPVIGMYIGPPPVEASPEPEDAPIPSTLDEAVDVLIGLLPPDERKNFMDIPRDEVMGRTHFTMGMAIRNSWHLWDKNSPMMRQFPGQQPDDVSSLIIDTAWQKLQNGGD